MRYSNFKNSPKIDKFYLFIYKLMKTYNKTITIQKFTNKVNVVKYNRVGKNHEIIEIQGVWKFNEKHQGKSYQSEYKLLNVLE